MFGRRFLGGRYFGARFFGDGGVGTAGDYLGKRYAGPRYFGPRYFSTTGGGGGGGGPTYTLNADAGTLTLTGQDAKRDMSMSADAGTLTLTGYDATLTLTGAGPDYTLTADAGTLTLTGQAAALTRAYLLNADAGTLTLTGQAVSFSYSGDPITYTLDAEAGTLTLTGFAADLYAGGGTTEAVMYLPIRSFAGGGAPVVGNSNLDTLKSLLPRQPQIAMNADGTMTAPWYRFFDYLVNNYLDALNQPTIADIVASVDESKAAATTATQSIALVAQQTQANADALAATVEVVTNSSLPGSSQIPPVSRSYLEP
jgi:hypothetical protein